MDMENYDIIILGGGPSGLTAAIYAAREKLKVAVIEQGAVGGQMATTNEIENYPGMDSIDGAELASLMANQAKKFGAKIIEYAEVKEARLEGDAKIIKTAKGDFSAKAVIISTGAREKKLGVPGETELKGRGVSYCATCDGPFFRDRDVAVIGGGNSAISEALHLVKFAKSVTIIHRRQTLRADMERQERARQNPKIKFMLDCTVEEIAGEGKVQHVKIANLKTNEKQDVAVDGVFIYIGTLPNTELFRGQVELDKRGHVMIDTNCKTNLKGVFASGDATNFGVKQVATAVGLGTVAALSASAFISGE